MPERSWSSIPFRAFPSPGAFAPLGAALPSCRSPPRGHLGPRSSVVTARPGLRAALPVHAGRARPFGEVRLQGFAPRDESVARAPVLPPANGPMLSWDSALIGWVFHQASWRRRRSTATAAGDPGQPSGVAEARRGPAGFRELVPPRTKAARAAPPKHRSRVARSHESTHSRAGASPSAQPEPHTRTGPAPRKQSPTSRDSPRSAAGAPLVACLTPRRPSPPGRRTRTTKQPKPRGRAHRSPRRRTSEARLAAPENRRDGPS
jgi:hypothetical protein